MLQPEPLYFGFDGRTDLLKLWVRLREALQGLKRPFEIFESTHVGRHAKSEMYEPCRAEASLADFAK